MAVYPKSFLQEAVKQSLEYSMQAGQAQLEELSKNIDRFSKQAQSLIQAPVPLPQQDPLEVAPQHPLVTDPNLGPEAFNPSSFSADPGVVPTSSEPYSPPDLLSGNDNQQMFEDPNQGLLNTPESDPYLNDPTLTSDPSLSSEPSYPSSTGGGNPEVSKWGAQIQAAANKYGVPASLIAGTMETESGGRTHDENGQPLRSSAGATSLMQVMPNWFKDGENPDDPQTNIDKGAMILADNYRRYGSWDKASAAYLGAIDADGNIKGSSDVTQDGNGYVAKFRENSAKYGDLDSGAVIQRPMPQEENGTSGLNIADQMNSGFSQADAVAACGIVLATAFAKANGRNPTEEEAINLAKAKGLYDPVNGMHGPESEVQIMKELGVAAHTESGADWSKIQKDVNSGNPVGLSTANHYWGIDGYDKTTDKYHVGNSGTVYAGGSQWMSATQIENIGGGSNVSIFVDSPLSKGLSTSNSVDDPNAQPGEDHSSYGSRMMDMFNKKADEIGSGFLGAAEQGVMNLKDIPSNLNQGIDDTVQKTFSSLAALPPVKALGDMFNQGGGSIAQSLSAKGIEISSFADNAHSSLDGLFKDIGNLPSTKPEDRFGGIGRSLNKDWGFEANSEGEYGTGILNKMKEFEDDLGIAATPNPRYYSQVTAYAAKGALSGMIDIVKGITDETKNIDELLTKRSQGSDNPGDYFNIALQTTFNAINVTPAGALFMGEYGLARQVLVDNGMPREEADRALMVAVIAHGSSGGVRSLAQGWDKGAEGLKGLPAFGGAVKGAVESTPAAHVAGGIANILGGISKSAVNTGKYLARVIGDSLEREPRTVHASFSGEPMPTGNIPHGAPATFEEFGASTIKEGGGTYDPVSGTFYHGEDGFSVGGEPGAPTKNGVFTLNKKTGEWANERGQSPGQMAEEFATANQDKLASGDKYIGSWVQPASRGKKDIYLDVATVHPDEAGAVAAGTQRGEQSAWDFKNNREVPIMNKLESQAVKDGILKPGDRSGSTVDPNTFEHIDRSEGDHVVSNAHGVTSQVLMEKNGRISTQHWTNLTLKEAGQRFVSEHPEAFSDPNVKLGYWKKGDYWHLDANTVHSDPREALQATFDRRAATGYSPKVGSPVNYDLGAARDEPLNPSIRSAVDRSEKFNPNDPVYDNHKGDQLNFDSSTEFAKYRQNDRRVASGEISSWSRAGREYVMKYSQADAHGNPTEVHSFTPDTVEHLPNGDIILDEIKSNQFRGYPQNMAKEEGLGVLKPGVAYPVEDTNFVLPAALRGDKKVFIRFSTEETMAGYEPGGIEAFRRSVTSDIQDFRSRYSDKFNPEQMDSEVRKLQAITRSSIQDPIAGMTSDEVRTELRRLYEITKEHEVNPPDYINARGETVTTEPYHGNQVTAGIKGKILGLSEALARREGVEPTSPVPHVMSHMPWNAERGAPELPSGQPMWGAIPGGVMGAGGTETDEEGKPKFSALGMVAGMAIGRGSGSKIEEAMARPRPRFGNQLPPLAPETPGITMHRFNTQAEADAYTKSRLKVPVKAAPTVKEPVLGPNTAREPLDATRPPLGETQRTMTGLSPEELMGPNTSSEPGSPGLPQTAGQKALMDVPPPDPEKVPKGMMAEAWVHAVRYASMLSSTATGVANIVTGTYQVSRKVAVDMVSQHPGKSWEELKGMMGGLHGAAQSGLENALTGSSDITRALNEQRGTNIGSTLAPGASLPGPLGKALAIPTNLLRGPDAFFHQLTLSAELGRLSAIHGAEVAAKYGVSLEDAVKHIVSGKDQGTLEAAAKVADKITYRTPLTGAGAKVQELVNAIPGGKFVVPFIHAVHNITATAVEELPGIGAGFRDQSLSGSQQVASQGIAIATGAAAVGLAMQGNLSGAGPSDPQERARLMRDGWQPYSVRVGGVWRQYSQIGPLALTLGTAANAWEAHSDTKTLESKGVGGQVTSFAKDFVASLSNNSYARGVLDLTKLMDEKSGENQWDQFVASQASSFIPMGGAVNQASSAFDKVTRDPQGIGERLQARTPLRGSLPAKLNEFGQEVPNAGQGLGSSLPFRANIQVASQADKEFTRLQIPISATGDKIGTQDLNTEQAHEYQKLSGGFVKGTVEGIMQTPDYQRQSDAEKTRTIERIKTAAVNLAQNEVVDVATTIKKPEGEPYHYLGVTDTVEENRIDISKAKVSAWKDAAYKGEHVTPPSQEDFMRADRQPSYEWHRYLLNNAKISRSAQMSVQEFAAANGG